MIGIGLRYVVASWMASLVPPESVPWTYTDTADAIAEACEEAPAFGSPVRCAAVMVAIAYHESRFRPDAIGDRGQSIGPWQISRSWLRPGDDLRAQAAVAVRLAERSRVMCGRAHLDESLSWYASGGRSCGRPASSRLRMRLAASLLR
jgi:hypothetical protein